MVFSVASLSGGCMRITKWKDIPVELFWEIDEVWCCGCLGNCLSESRERQQWRRFIDAQGFGLLSGWGAEG